MMTLAAAIRSAAPALNEFNRKYSWIADGDSFLPPIRHNLTTNAYFFYRLGFAFNIVSGEIVFSSRRVRSGQL